MCWGVGGKTGPRFVDEASREVVKDSQLAVADEGRSSKVSPGTLFGPSKLPFDFFLFCCPDFSLRVKTLAFITLRPEVHLGF